MDARKQAQLPHAVVKQEEEEDVDIVPGSNPQVMPLTSGSAVGARNAASSGSQLAAEKSGQKRRRNLALALSQEEEEELNPYPTQQEKTVQERVLLKMQPVVQEREKTDAPVVQGSQESKAAAEMKKTATTGTWRMSIDSTEDEEEEEEEEEQQIEPQAEEHMEEVGEEVEAIKEDDGAGEKSQESEEDTYDSSDDTSDENFSLGQEEVTSDRDSSDGSGYVKEPPLVPVPKTQPLLVAVVAKKTPLVTVVKEEENVMEDEQEEHAVEEAPMITEGVQHHWVEEAKLIEEAVQQQHHAVDKAPGITDIVQQQLDDDEYDIPRVRNFEGFHVV